MQSIFQFIKKGCWLLWLCSPLVFAGEVKHPEPFVLPFERVEVIDESHFQGDWVLPLSHYQKVDGVWRLSASTLVKGKVSKKIYQIHSTHSFQQAESKLKAWVKDQGEALYQCEERACGSSNDWANQVFEDKRLNGLPNKQTYYSLKTKEGFVSLYLVQRPTGYRYLAVVTINL